MALLSRTDRHDSLFVSSQFLTPINPVFGPQRLERRLPTCRPRRPRLGAGDTRRARRGRDLNLRRPSEPTTPSAEGITQCHALTVQRETKSVTDEFKLGSLDVYVDEGAVRVGIRVEGGRNPNTVVNAHPGCRKATD